MDNRKVERLKKRLETLERRSRDEFVYPGTAITGSAGLKRSYRRRLERQLERTIDRAVEIGRLKAEISRLTTPLTRTARRKREKKRRSPRHPDHQLFDNAVMDLQLYGAADYRGHRIESLWEWDEERRELSGFVSVDGVKHPCGAQGVHFEKMERQLLQEIDRSQP